MNSTFKRKLTSLLLIVIMLVSLCPIAAFADDANVDSITVTFSSQADGWFTMAPQEITVSSNTAESYGFDLDSSTDVVTTLDVLVAANVAYADSLEQKFNPATITTDDDNITTYANGFLTIKNTTTYGASIYEMFDKESTNCSFTVNGATPHNDVYNEDWNSYTGYTISQATVKDGDNVEFFFYQDSYAMDKYAFFTDENGNRLSKLYLCPNEDATLTLKGYPIGWYGCSTDEWIAAFTNKLINCSLILVDSTATPIYEGALAETILATTTDSNGSCTISFPENGTYYLTTTEPEYDHAILPWLEIEVGAFEKATEPNYENKVYTDFTNDIWLQYDFKELTIGDTATIFPRRIEQIISDGSATAQEYYCRPNFNFNIIAGDSIKLNTNDSTAQATVTAVKPGDSIVMVSYDAVTDENKDITYAACSEVNYAYVIYSVSDKDTPNITISTDIPYTSYDTLYYADGEGYTLDFKVTANGADSVTVTVNGEKISSDQKDVYHALLTNRSNIIGIIAADENGNTKSYYQVIDARKIEITAENGLDATRPLTNGEEVQISFNGITMPVYKLSGIYNPAYYYHNPEHPDWDTDSTHVVYNSADFGTLKGYCQQNDLATNNTISFTPAIGGKYTLTDGQITSVWYGAEIGTDKLNPEDSYNKWEGYAPTVTQSFSVLPDISLDIAYANDAVRVESVSLDKTTATLNVGDTLELLATVAPSNALNQKVSWTLTNTQTNDVESYYATIDQNGKITALNPTPSGATLVATVTTADGNHTASCTFTIKGNATTIKKNKVNISIDSYTANNQSIINLTAIDYQEGDTVWSATKRLLDNQGITYTYNSKKTGYVSEINGLKELDYGEESGWMYSVNGDYPDTGCGAYEISAGDTIRWRYTLNLGKDLGVTVPGETEKPSTGGGAGGAAATKPSTEKNDKPATTETTPTAPIFSDVPANAWYYTTVTNIATKGLMTGTSTNTFEPNKVTTRAELVAILYRLQNNPAVYGDSKFADVSTNAWYADPVIWAENMHIISGMDANHFAPNEALTREQVVAILMNYAKACGYDTTLGGMAIREYADYDSISAYALPSMNWAVASGIIKGKDGNTLDPQGTATRAEIAAMLERFIVFYEIY